MNIKRKIALALTNSIFCGTRPNNFPIKNRLLNWGGFSIGKGAKIVGPIFITGNLYVGENTWIGRAFSVDGNGTVYIGDNCDIAPSVHCYTGGHEIGDRERRAGIGYNSDIRIGNGCWICAETKVLPNVQIADSVVIAAGTVVNKSILQSDVLVGGVPAKKIKDLY